MTNPTDATKLLELLHQLIHCVIYSGESVMDALIETDSDECRRLRSELALFEIDMDAQAGRTAAPVVTEAEKILAHLIFEMNGMADGADAKADADRWYRSANALHTVQSALTAALAKGSAQ